MNDVSIFNTSYQLMWYLFVLFILRVSPNYCSIKKNKHWMILGIQHPLPLSLLSLIIYPFRYSLILCIICYSYYEECDNLNWIDYLILTTGMNQERKMSEQLKLNCQDSVDIGKIKGI